MDGWQEKVREFANLVQHGDDVHRAWLLEAAEAFINGRNISPPRNSDQKPPLLPS